MVTSDGCSGWSHGAGCGVAFLKKMILSEYVFTLSPPLSLLPLGFCNWKGWKVACPSNLFTECVYEWGYMAC